MRDRVAWYAVLLVGLAGGCGSPSGPETPGKPGSPPVLDPGLRGHHRKVSTSSAEAQAWFDQGLTLTYAFNHDEAVASFAEAARLDPSCAMASWGIALAHGPHYNNPAMTAERSREAWTALEAARAAAEGESPVELALLEALGHRYAEDPPADRKPLDRAWADAMRKVWQAHPGDPDAGTLYAESLMNLHPWDLWTKDGRPKADTAEITAVLETVLRMQPLNPGANHLYIHAVEASPAPEKAAEAADRLRTLVPGAGHLVHMPAHIDLRLGHYAAASQANLDAMAADRAREARFPRGGFYRLYMAHNPHFLAFSSMMEGRYEAALAAARDLVASMPKEFIQGQTKLADGFLPAAVEVQIRFGRWEEILAIPPFDAALTVSNALRHHARGTAFAATGRLPEARAELAALDLLAGGVDDRAVGQSPARTVLKIPVRMLAGEIAFREGRIDEAIAKLREGAAIEDTLNYDEPPDWMLPVRHALAAACLESGRWSEAETVLQEDLRRFPENGWALRGLVRAARGRGDDAAARDAEARFARAWSRADVEISSPCLCLPGG